MHEGFARFHAFKEIRIFSAIFAFFADFSAAETIFKNAFRILARQQNPLFYSPADVFSFRFLTDLYNIFTPKS